jgi:hypothetical protein
MNNLYREDLVGKRVKEVLQTPWINNDGFESCEIFINLDNGFTFKLPFLDDDESVFPIKTEKNHNLIKAEFPLNSPEYFNMEITDIVSSDYWPSIALKLNNQYLLMINIWNSPFITGAVIVENSDIKSSDINSLK